MRKKTLNQILDPNTLENGRIYKVTLRGAYLRKPRTSSLKLLYKQFTQDKDDTTGSTKQVNWLHFVSINEQDRKKTNNLKDFPALVQYEVEKVSNRKDNFTSANILVYYDDFNIDFPEDPTLLQFRGTFKEDEIRYTTSGPVEVECVMASDWLKELNLK